MTPARAALLGFFITALSCAPTAAQQPARLADLAARIESEWSRPVPERLDTIRAIGALRTEPAAALLARLFAQDSNPELRKAVIAALGDNGTPEALRALQPCLTPAAGDADLHAAVASALGAFPGTDALRCLTALYGRSAGETAVRQAIAEVVRNFAGRGVDAEVDAFYLSALEDPYTWVKVESLRFFAHRPNARVVRTAKQIFAANNPPEVLREALEPLCRAGTLDAYLALFDAAVRQKEPAMRDMLIDALAESSLPETIEHATRSAHENRDPTVRRIAVALLAHRSDAAGLEAIRQALRDRDPDVRLEAVRAIAARNVRDAAEEVLALAGDSPPELAQAAVEALVVLHPDTPEFARRLIDAVKALPPETQLDLAPALKRLEAPGALDPLLALLDHDSWSVQAGAIATLRDLRRKEGIAPLIARLAKEVGRLRYDIAAALAALTGKKLGADAAAWKAWWAENAAAFEMPADAAPQPADEHETTYYGIPVVSKWITFLVDASISMGESGLTAETRGSRFTAAKKELSDTIRRLAPDVRFNVVFFNDRQDRWEPQVRKASERRKQEALQFVYEYAACGGTNLYDALAAALDENEIDTLFLLSDGKAGTGAWTEPASILREIGKLNRRRRIAIHTISVGESVEWLKELAEQNGGMHVKR